MLWLDNGHLTDILDIFGTFIGRINTNCIRKYYKESRIKGVRMGLERGQRRQREDVISKNGEDPERSCQE